MAASLLGCAASDRGIVPAHPAGRRQSQRNTAAATVQATQRGGTRMRERKDSMQNQLHAFPRLLELRISNTPGDPARRDRFGWGRMSADSDFLVLLSRYPRPGSRYHGVRGHPASVTAEHKAPLRLRPWIRRGRGAATAHGSPGPVAAVTAVTATAPQHAPPRSRRGGRARIAWTGHGRTRCRSPAVRPTRCAATCRAWMFFAQNFVAKVP